jgi:prephenate dehydrogenase
MVDQINQTEISMMYFYKVTILGVGLIGASLALALKKYHLAKTVVGYGRTQGNLIQAQERAIIDSFALDPAEACDNADLIVFATPVGAFIDIAKRIQPVFKSDVIVTDVGSVKGNLVRDMERVLSPNGLFVGGHPIAGSDRSGIDTASAELFEQAKCIITPTHDTDKSALEKIIAIWRAVGCLVTLIDPDEHDRIYGAVSHLAHVLAYELINTVDDINSTYLTFSGQGLKDTTRIASSRPELWRDICIHNRRNLLAYLEAYQKNLDKVSRHLREDDRESLLMDFQRARTLRENLGQD